MWKYWSLKLMNEVLKFMHEMHIKIQDVLLHLLFTKVRIKHECASVEECWFVYKSAVQLRTECVSWALCRVWLQSAVFSCQQF